MIRIIFYTFSVICITLFHFQCASTSTRYVSIKKVYDPSEDILTYIMEGNNIPIPLSKIFRTKACSLNPGRIHSKDSGIYYILKLSHVSVNDTFIITPENKMEINVDDRIINIYPSSIFYDINQVIAYYNIEMLDIIEIGNSNFVKILIKGRDDSLKTEFSSRNIASFKNFANKYILSTQESSKIIKKKSGHEQKSRIFVSAGAGTGYEFWIAYYTNILNIKTKPNWSDFIAIGSGYTYFKYDRYRLIGYTPDIPPIYYYSYHDSHKNSIWYISSMYGLTFPSGFGNWSFEVGLTAKYYNIVEKNWDKYVEYNTDFESVPQYKYKIVDGDILKGFAIGAFVQAGALWFSIDSKKVWAIGLTAPISF